MAALGYCFRPHRKSQSEKRSPVSDRDLDIADIFGRLPGSLDRLCCLSAVGPETQLQPHIVSFRGTFFGFFAITSAYTSQSSANAFDMFLKYVLMSLLPGARMSRRGLVSSCCML